jgi:hypothetical protein
MADDPPPQAPQQPPTGWMNSVDSAAQIAAQDLELRKRFFAATSGGASPPFPPPGFPPSSPDGPTGVTGVFATGVAGAVGSTGGPSVIH